MEYTILLVVEVLSALGLVGLVLLQQGKGADVGASFGAGASQTIFGSSGSGNFMTRMTAIFATIFFVTCLGLGYFASQKSQAKPESLDFTPVIETSDSGELPPVDVLSAELPAHGDLPPVPADAVESPASEGAAGAVQDNAMQDQKAVPSAAETAPSAAMEDLPTSGDDTSP